MSVICQNNVPSVSQEKEVTRKKRISNEKTKLNETKKQITGK